MPRKSSAASPEVPSAVTAPCPDCEEDTLHRVLRATVSGKGRKYVLQGTAQCAECERVHPITLREAADVEVPVVVSQGAKSHRTRITFAADDPVKVDDMLIVDGRNAKVTGIELEHRRVEKAPAGEIRTLWVTDWESVSVPVGVNLGKKSITKRQEVPPETSYEIGQRLLLDKLDVTIHSIKTHARLITRGSAMAADIARINTKPTPFPKPYRPPKPVREQRRRDWEKEDR